MGLFLVDDDEIFPTAHGLFPSDYQFRRYDGLFAPPPSLSLIGTNSPERIGTNSPDPIGTWACYSDIGMSVTHSRLLCYFSFSSMWQCRQCVFILSGLNDNMHCIQLCIPMYWLIDIPMSFFLVSHWRGPAPVRLICFSLDGFDIYVRHNMINYCEQKTQFVCAPKNSD